MHEWTGLSRGRALALVCARDPREHGIGIFQRDPMPPPHHGPGTFIWFPDTSEAADFMSQVVPVLLLDPDSWPDFDDLVADTTRIVRAVPDDGAPPAAALRALAEPWGGRGDFVWWGGFDEITTGQSDFGRLIRMQYLEWIDDPVEDRPIEADETDALVSFLRAYPH